MHLFSRHSGYMNRNEPSWKPYNQKTLLGWKRCRDVVFWDMIKKGKKFNMMCKTSPIDRNGCSVNDALYNERLDWSILSSDFKWHSYIQSIVKDDEKCLVPSNALENTSLLLLLFIITRVRSERKWSTVAIYEQKLPSLQFSIAMGYKSVYVPL